MLEAESLSMGMAMGRLLSRNRTLMQMILALFELRMGCIVWRLAVMGAFSEHRLDTAWMKVFHMYLIVP